MNMETTLEPIIIPAGYHNMRMAAAILDRLVFLL